MQAASSEIGLRQANHMYAAGQIGDYVELTNSKQNTQQFQSRGNDDGLYSPYDLSASCVVFHI